MASQSQRYRLTYEFILKDRGDYAFVRLMIEKALTKVTKAVFDMQADFLSIKKVQDGLNKPDGRDHGTIEGKGKG